MCTKVALKVKLVEKESGAGKEAWLFVVYCLTVYATRQERKDEEMDGGVQRQVNKSRTRLEYCVIGV